jgi:Zn-dependent metalloprotease
MKSFALASSFVALGALAVAPALTAQTPVVGRQIVASASSLGRGFSDAAALMELREWNALVIDWLQSGDLTRVSSHADPFVPGRTIERLQQSHHGVPVWSGDVRRQLNAFGQAESIFGTYYPDVDVDTTPAITESRAAFLLAAVGHGAPGPAAPVDLEILPSATGFHLAWTADVVSVDDAVMRRIFVDASSGDTLLSYDDTWTQAPTRNDQPRSVFDMRGDATSLARALSGEARLAPPASAPGDPQTLISIDEAQACLDATTDFFQRRFGRAGLDNHGKRVRLLINPETDPAATDPYPKFASGAYYGGGDVVLGARAGGQSFLDVLGLVAHEVAHGITEYSSGLIYLDESGALNEAFSDIMASSARLDVETAGGVTDPPRWPDAFVSAQPQTTATTADNGGVHANAATITHVFWISATTADRKEIERVFYRAFTSLLPANATFNVARAATIQSAIDLDGAGSDVERAVASAWAAGLR